MPAPSTVIVPLADALKQMLEGLDFAPAVKAYRWAPSMVATVPAAVIDIPEVRRTGIDEPEEQLGSDDWTLTFPVELLVDLAVAETATDPRRRAARGVHRCRRRQPVARVPDRRRLQGHRRHPQLRPV
jgi:hypothetical protein